MTTKGAQIRLVHEYIHSTTGQWLTNTSGWVDATVGQLESFQQTVLKQKHRADRRHWRIEYRRFSVQVHTVGMNTNWGELDVLIQDDDPLPKPPSLIEQLRKIASRGRVDDADVQILFDAADKLEQLEAT